MELHKNQINSGVGFVFFLFSKIQKLLFLFKLVVVGLHLHITQLWNFEVCVFVVSKKIKKQEKKVMPIIYSMPNKKCMPGHFKVQRSAVAGTLHHNRSDHI